jgi:hypothetical protein
LNVGKRGLGMKVRFGFLPSAMFKGGM